MNIIREQRETVNKENNTAQTQMMNILDSMNKKTNAIEIREPLHGQLDFSILREMGFGMIESIVLVEGEITDIANLPQGLKTLECPKNLLFSLENIPVTLENLIIPYNYLTTVDVSALENLKVLNVAYNKLALLNKFPLSIVEIRCDHNADLQQLNLLGLDNLKLLHISNTKIALIENMPEGVADFQMDNTPNIEFRNATLISGAKRDDDQAKKMNYIESLNEYFRLKASYEKKLYTMKKKAVEKAGSKKEAKRNLGMVKAKCITCDRPVGSIFSKKNNRYAALCGDPKAPCKLDIQIFSGIVNPLSFMLDIYREDIDSLKDAVIQQKLDTLFSYVSEEESVELFKKELEAYNEGSKTFKGLLDRQNELFFNKDKKELIDKKNDTVFRLIETIRKLLEEYVKTANRKLLETAMDLQVNELLPEIRNLRILKSEIMQINESEKSNVTTYGLFKFPVELDKLDHSFSEPPRVIKFIH